MHFVRSPFAACVRLAVRCKHKSKCILWLIVVFLNVCFINSSMFDSPTFSFHKSAAHPQLRNYELITVKHLKRKVLKRETHVDATNEVTFHATGREFKLLLHHDEHLLSPTFNAFEVDASGTKRLVNVDRNEYFVGTLSGNKKSAVSAHLDSSTGMLTASIHDDDNNELFHIEPHDDDDNLAANSTTTTTTMRFYKASDVKHSWSFDADDHQRVGAEASNTNNNSISSFCDSVKIADEFSEKELIRPKRSSKYNVPTRNDDLWLPSEHTDSDADNADGTRCSLLLVADHLFYKEMGGSDLKRTISFLIALIGRVNAIYTKTNFSDDDHDEDAYKRMGFLIQEVVVHREPLRTRPHERHYNMATNHWKVRELLEYFSREPSHDHYCLAHLFTHRKFDNAVLGLAYVASPKQNSVGGICSPGYYKNGATLFLNSGLTTTKNTFGKRVITREADLVTAHEFGHNWGAEHDPDLRECSPSASRGGSYIMYTFSVSGYDPNNKLFSPCSRRSIKAVLKAKASRCFLSPRKSFCGNGLIEVGEECDEGFIGAEESGQCCTRDCKLRLGTSCSDKNSPCCRDCRFIPNVHTLCRNENNLTCQTEAYCAPDRAECPRSEPQADGTECLDKGQCRRGVCQPYCEAKNMHSCMCDSLKDACRRCCRNNVTSKCMPYDPREILLDGTPCHFGVCKNGICERSGRDNIRRFWRLIDKADVSAIAKFLKDNIVGFVILVSIVVWIPSTYLIEKYDKKFNQKVAQRRSERLRSRRSTTSQQRTVVLAVSDTRCAPVAGVEDDEGFNDTYRTNGAGQSRNRNQRPYDITYAPVTPSRGVGFRPRVVYLRQRPRNNNETDATVEARNGDDDKEEDDEVDDIEGRTSAEKRPPIPSTEL